MSKIVFRENEYEVVPSIQDKTLRINLNQNIYGSFAEIGAGQETARHFFRAGGASGTIAKAMSAYDKSFSDAVYGREEDGRYVTESRLNKMLDHETNLLEERIDRSNNPEYLFFTYANTVATIDFSKRYKGHGWIGIQFQLEPNQKEYNRIVLHVRFKQIEARLQQETCGIVGVNLIYGAFYKHDEPKKLLRYLYDHIDKDTLEIDMINFSGPHFSQVDNRLMSLQLIKNDMTEAVMFGPDGNNILPAALLYKKNILALRGSFRPVTKVNIDMLEKSQELFCTIPKVAKANTEIIFEITLENLKAYGDIDEKDFLARAELIGSLGHIVMISKFKEYYKLVEYFDKYTKSRIALSMGINSLVDIFDEKYYRHLSGGILEAFGKLFFKNVQVYLYPMKDPNTGAIINSDNLIVSEQMKDLYKFFKHNNKLTDIEDYEEANLSIYSREVLQMISNDVQGWEAMLPEGIADIIKKNQLFKNTKVSEEVFPYKNVLPNQL